MSLGRFVGPLLAGFLFDIKVYMPYLVGSLVMFLGFIFVQTQLKEPQIEPVITQDS